MTNQEQVNSILAMDDGLAMVETITDGMPVDDYSPEDDKDITLDDIFGVTPNDTPKTFGDSFASIGDDTLTETGRKQITEEFISEINKLPGTTVEVSDIPAIAATIQMRTGLKGDIEKFLADTIMQTVNTLAEQNKTALNPNGAVSDMGVGAPAVEPSVAAPEAPTEPLPEVTPIAPAPEPTLDINPDDGAIDTGIDDAALAAATDDLDSMIPEDEPADIPSDTTDTSDVDDALAGLDNLDDDMFDGDGSGEDTDAGEESSSEEPAEDKPAEDKPAEDKPAEDKPAEDKPAEDEPSEDEPSEGDTGAKVESASDSRLPPMLESALDRIHSEYVAKEAKQDAERAEFVRNVATIIESNAKKKTAMVESAALRRKKLDAIVEGVQKQVARRTMVENAAKIIVADKKKAAILESIVNDAARGMHDIKKTDSIKAKLDAIVESVSRKASAKKAVDAKLDAIVESVSHKASAKKAVDAKLDAIVESVSRRASAKKAVDREALIESIVSASAQARLNKIRERALKA